MALCCLLIIGFVLNAQEDDCKAYKLKITKANGDTIVYTHNGDLPRIDTLKINGRKIWNSDEPATFPYAMDNTLNYQFIEQNCSPVEDKSCPGTPTVTDLDGNVYPTVLLGTQCWMAQNLRTTKYAGGSNVATYYHANGSSNDVQYGLLYPWTSVMNGASSSNENPSGVQGVCPAGWHVPSNAEWTAMTGYVASQSGFLCDENSSYIAKSLASKEQWSSDDGTCYVGNDLTANTAAGFNAMPAGFSDGSTPNGFSYNANFWTATQSSDTYAHSLRMYYNSNAVESTPNSKSTAYSVRCVKGDASPAPVSYTITFNANEGSGTMNPQQITGTANLTTNTFTRENYTFTGWNTVAGGTGDAYADGASITPEADMTLYAQWEAPQVSYTITFDRNGGTGSMAAQQISGTANLNTNTTITREGYTFNGWNTTKLGSGTAYADGASITPENNMTLYAQWFGTPVPCPGSPTVTDNDGHTYNTVQYTATIQVRYATYQSVTQCWMAENLRTTKAPDGSTLDYRHPGNDGANDENYDLLYTWETAMNGANSSATNPSGVPGICPEGWHLPGTSEWTYLSNIIKSNLDYNCDGDINNIGKALASNVGWLSPSGATGSFCVVGDDPSSNNASTFNLKPAGSNESNYEFFRKYAYLWHASASNTDNTRAYVISLANSLSYLQSNGSVLLSRERYFSVRCVKD